MEGSRTDGNNRVVLAHRFAYEMLIGPIPEGLESDHLCRNRPCVRSTHIEPVTRSENLRRSPLKKGEAHPRAKLTEEQVKEIRRLRGILGHRKTAAHFGVSPRAIRAIRSGKNWSHI